jgi:protein TonB
MILLWRSALTTAAVLVNAGLYVLMESMIEGPGNARLDVVETQTVDFVRTPMEEQTRTKDRRRPPPPKPREMERPRSRMDTEFDSTPTDLPMDLAAMNVTSVLGAGAGGVALGARLVQGDGSGRKPAIVDVSSLTPISMLPPRYPRRALAQDIEGWVSVIFRIDDAGNARDPVILEAQPAEVFDQAALTAVKRWRFRAPERGPDDPPVYAQARITFVRESSQHAG